MLTGKSYWFVMMIMNKILVKKSHPLVRFFTYKVRKNIVKKRCSYYFFVGHVAYLRPHEKVGQRRIHVSQQFSILFYLVVIKFGQPLGACLAREGESTDSERNASR